MVEQLGCPICAHPQCKQIELALSKKDLKVRDVCDALRTDKVVVELHLKEHMPKRIEAEKQGKPVPAFEKPSKREVSEAQKQIDTHNMLMNNLMGLSDKLAMHIDSDDNTVAGIKNLVALAAEVRKTIIDLAQLEGKLQVQQNVTINQYNTLKAVVLTALCPQCRANLLKQMEKYGSGEVITV